MSSNPPVYGLGVIIQSGEANTFYNVRDLSESEYNAYGDNIAVLMGYSTDEKLLDIVEDAFAELESGLKTQSSVLSAQSRTGVPNLLGVSVKINGLILNVLSSIRTYQDHTETRLKRQAVNSDVDVAAFKEATGKAFDGHYEYRFTEKLRNYAQHCGMPSSSISISSSINNPDKMRVILDRDMLLEKFSSWGGVVKQELKDGPAEFDVLPLLTKKVELLREIDAAVNQRALQQLNTPATVLLNLIQETQAAKPFSSPHLIKVEGDIDEPHITLTHFPFEVITKITDVTFVPAVSGGNSLQVGGSLDAG
jgi:hypothetical protein